MTIELTQLVTVGIPTIGIVVWLVRLEGRINLTESRYNDLKSDVLEIKRDVKALLGQNLAGAGRPRERV